MISAAMAIEAYDAAGRLMDYLTHEEQHAIRETFRKLVDERIVPRAGEIDRAAVFPKDEFRAVGELGFFGMRYPEEVGGSGQDVVSYCLAVEELARGSLSVAASVHDAVADGYLLSLPLR